MNLLHLRARWYDSETGTFLSRDPVESEPPYLYVRGNPINRIDPTGLCENFGDSECWSIYRQITDMCSECANMVRDTNTGPRSLHEETTSYLQDVLERVHAGWRPSYGWSPNDPLTPSQWRLSKEKARLFEVPVELVAGTVAVEIVHDTDWYDYYLDVYLQMLPLIIHQCPPEGSGNLWLRDGSDWFLGGYEHYWGLLGGRGPGNGVSNVHILTAKRTENYFAKNYPGDTRLLPAHNIYHRMATLQTDSGNIHYAAAILRMLADKRTGVMGPHHSLSDTDMEVIYSAFRSDLNNCYGDVVGYRSAFASPQGCLGWQIRGYLDLYRTKLQAEKNMGTNE
ncbi:MAG: hypothetical protein DPW09_17110 [Anaerolineae bacterium]|nr:hypothetical protein [Anaerolineales bacterium]MCQ3975163.1 hypothetical protein [Anaerolineae bacterium]